MHCITSMKVKRGLGKIIYINMYYSYYIIYIGIVLKTYNALLLCIKHKIQQKKFIGIIY